MLVFGLVLCNEVTVRVSAGAAEEGGGWWVEAGGRAGQGEWSSELSEDSQECSLYSFSGRARANVKVCVCVCVCVRERERERETEREREGVFVITLLQLVWDLSLTVAAW